MLQNRKAFTLLELIVVIVVAGILSGIAIPTFQAIKNKSNEQRAVQEASAVAKEASGLAAFSNPAVVADSHMTEAAGDSAGTYDEATDTFTASNGYEVGILMSGGTATADSSDVVAP